jgi:hypothetical protein
MKKIGVFVKMCAEIMKKTGKYGCFSLIPRRGRQAAGQNFWGTPLPEPPLPKIVKVQLFHMKNMIILGNVLLFAIDSRCLCSWSPTAKSPEKCFALPPACPAGDLSVNNHFFRY